MDLLALVALLVLGSFTGFAAGLLGIGGGMVMVPFMTMTLEHLGVPASQVVKVAIATSLASILFTSISSTRAHHLRGAVRWTLARALAPGLLAGSLAGAQVAGTLSDRWLAAGFGAFLCLSAARMFTAKPPVGQGLLPGAAGMFAAGTGIGTVSALLGAGGAFLTVPFLARRDVPMTDAVATSAACGFPIALAGTLGYIWAGRHLSLPAASLGYLHLPALLAVSAASVMTAPLGARAAHALPTATLKRIFAVLLFGLATYMLGRALRG